MEMTQTIIKTSTMNVQRDNDDFDALLRYIKQLERSIAEKDALLATKDHIINALEEVVSQSKITSPMKTKNVAPNARPSIFAPSTPNHVSDDSGEVHPPSNDSVLDQSLSLIYHAHSSDEDSIADEATAADGRWNIPFDEASFDELVAKSSSGERKCDELVETGFMPIAEPSLWHSSHVTSSPLRPLALRRKSGSPRRRLSKEFTSGKENITPVKDPIGVVASFGVR